MRASLPKRHKYVVLKAEPGYAWFGARCNEVLAGQEAADGGAVGTTASRPAEDLAGISPWDKPNWQSTGVSGGLQRGQSLWQGLSTRCAASLAVLMNPLPGIEGTAHCRHPTGLGWPYPSESMPHYQCELGLQAHALWNCVPAS